MSIVIAFLIGMVVGIVYSTVYDYLAGNYKDDGK